MESTDKTWPLELTSDEFARLVALASQRIGRHLQDLPSQPVSDLRETDALCARLKEPLPADGEDFSVLLKRIFDDAACCGLNSASPGYLGYVPGGGIVHAAIADLISNAINRYVGVWAAAPGLVQIEFNVIRWFAEIVGYSTEASGFLTSGGSLANFSALFTARRDRLPHNFLNGTLYASEQTHHSVTRAAILAGFAETAIRKIPVDEKYRLCVSELRRQILEDRKRGLQPFLIVANAGTTNTGAIDPLPRIADLALEQNCWLHVDAAYGGFFMLTERGRQRLAGIDRADSITLDPHKGLFLPYGTGCLLVRNGNLLKQAHQLDADYLPGMQDHPERVDFCQISPELSRDFRGLRVWLPIKMHGTGAFRETLDEKLDLADWIGRQLRAIPELCVVAEPELSIVAFHVDQPEVETEVLNARTRQLMEAVNARNRVLLTGTRLAERFVIRICVLCFRSHRDRLEQCLQDIRDALAENQ